MGCGSKKSDAVGQETKIEGQFWSIRRRASGGVYDEEERRKNVPCRRTAPLSTIPGIFVAQYCWQQNQNNARSVSPASCIVYIRHWVRLPAGQLLSQPGGLGRHTADACAPPQEPS